jgi:hypothetical protein
MDTISGFAGRVCEFPPAVYEELADYIRSNYRDAPMRAPTDRVTEFLLAEHRYLADSFWRNEETGEKRVNFFITLVTAVLAALVALASNRGSLSSEQISRFAFAACLGLLVVGVLTFRRLLKRNGAADKYKAGMDVIRCHSDPGSGLVSVTRIRSEVFRVARPRSGSFSLSLSLSLSLSRCALCGGRAELPTVFASAPLETATASAVAYRELAALGVTRGPSSFAECATIGVTLDSRINIIRCRTPSHASARVRALAARIRKASRRR